MGIVFALLVILICRQSMGDAVFGDWGWRIPFLISAILVLLSGYIRSRDRRSTPGSRRRAKPLPTRSRPPTSAAATGA